MYAPVRKVTLYPGCAVVTRLAEIPEIAPDGRLVWDDLGVNIISGTARVKVLAGQATVLSVHPVMVRREEVAEADRTPWLERQKVLQNQITALEEWRSALLQHSLEPSSAELSPAQRLQFGLQSRAAVCQCLAQLETRSRELQLQLVEVERALETGRAEALKMRTSMEVRLESDGGPLQLELTYRIEQAGWTLDYQLELERPSRQGRLALWATMHQQTGESWQGAELTLYTVGPLLESDLPELASVHLGRASRPEPKETRPALASGVQLLNDYYRWVNAQRSVVEAPAVLQSLVKESLRSETRCRQVRRPESVCMMESRMAGAFPAPQKKALPPQEVPFLDYDLCRLDEADGPRRGRLYALPVALPENSKLREPGRRFQGEAPLDLPGDGRSQRVLLACPTVEVEYRWGCTPAQDAQVYCQAHFSNPLPQGLPAGSLRILERGVFLRDSTLAESKRGQPISVGLGVERLLSVFRRETKRSDKGQLGEFTSRAFGVELELVSSYAEEITVEVHEALPVSDDLSMKLKLLNLEPEAQPDGQGRFSWRVTLLPGEASKCSYRYRCQFPSTKELVWR